jgi:hypothetical protein
MIKEIIEKYGVFWDSWVSEILILDDEIHLLVTCPNILNNDKYETIKLICKKIESFTINKKHLKVMPRLSGALFIINEMNDSIIMDLEPLDYYDYFKEDPNSTFKIKCKKIDYKFIEEYIDN